MLVSLTANIAVLPPFLRCSSMIFLGCMPGVLTFVVWVLPTHRLDESFVGQAAELAAQLESKVGSATGSAQHKVSGEERRQVFRRFPAWHSDKVWLRDLVDLATSLGVSTQGLKHTGMSRKEPPSIVTAMNTARAESQHHGYLAQRGYEWRVVGAAADLGRLLGRLASHALWIDALDIWPVGSASVRLPATAERAQVTAMLTFRQGAWVSSAIQPLTAQVPADGRFETQPEIPSALPSLQALIADTDATCAGTSPEGGRLTESHRVFADLALEQIRLVGVIERMDADNKAIQQAVFRGASGSLVVAANDAEVSSSRLRLVELSKSRGVLYSKEQGPTVLRLEPVLMPSLRKGTATGSNHE